MTDLDLRRELELVGIERCPAGDALLEEMRAAGRGEGWMWEEKR